MRKLYALTILGALIRRGWQSQAAIRAHQNRKLRKVLQSASTLPYYRQLFQIHHVNPEAVTIEELPKLPILTREILRQNFPHNICNQNKNTALRFTRTSGSTGTPLTVAWAPKEHSIRRAILWYGAYKAGLTPADSLCRLGVGSENVTNPPLRSMFGLGGRYGLDIRHELTRTLDRLEALRPNALIANPSFLSLLAKFMRKTHRSLPSVRLILCGGETLTEEDCHLLQSTFTCAVRNFYSSEELGLIAFDCEQGLLHPVPDAGFVEVTNQDEHGVGEALITSLFQETTPLIRYRLGDRLKLEDTPCACGAPFQTISYIEGRCNDFVVLPSGQRISWRAISQFPSIPGILEHQIVQKRPDFFHVFIQKDKGFTETSAQLIRKCIRDGCLGEDIKIELVFVDKLTRERTGKLRAVISEVATQDPS